MPINKAKGNMYNFVSHTHNHLAGACPHQCTYCAIQDMARRFPVLRERYSGPIRVVEKEFNVKYDEKILRRDGGTYPGTIFMENCSDLFAEGVSPYQIHSILSHCRDWPENTYVFQTKNPGRVGPILAFFPPKFMIGTTAECNRYSPMLSYAPTPPERLEAMRAIEILRERKFVTVEPIVEFDHDIFLDMLLASGAGTVNIGADSKKHGLPEPTGREIDLLVGDLRQAGITVRLKPNLKRLIK